MLKRIFTWLFSWIFIFILILSIIAFDRLFPVNFGGSDVVHRLENISLKGPKGEHLYIGYKTSAFYFIAGIYIKDDGYVLGVLNKYAFIVLPGTKEAREYRSATGHYYPFPNEKDLLDHQNKGDMPNSLPEYSILTEDYLKGYSLWLILLCIKIYAVIKARIKKLRENNKRVG